MARHDLAERARDYIEVLTEALPQIQFQVYVSQDGVASPEAVNDLIIFGFITREVLVGGYEVPQEETPLDFTNQMLNVAQFFRRAWQGEAPRFYPSELQLKYEAHRESGALWRRVL